MNMTHLLGDNRTSAASRDLGVYTEPKSLRVQARYSTVTLFARLRGL
jgi:hypothetical protein